MAGPTPVPLNSITVLNDLPFGGVILISYPDPTDPTKRVFGAIAPDAIANAKASGVSEIPVSQVPFAPSLDNPDIFAVGQSGVTKKTTLASILALRTTGGTNPPPAPTFIESAEGASVTTVGPVITDGLGNKYGINGNKQIVTNGTVETASANVEQLYYHNHNLYRRNTSGNWFYRTGPLEAFIATTDPTGTVVVPPPSQNTYVPYASSLPNVLHVFDFGAPAGTADLAVGTPGIKYANAGLDVVQIEDAKSGALISSGYGSVAYKSSGGPNNKPYVHGDSLSFNNAYDSIIPPTSTAQAMFGPTNEAYTVIWVMRQTAPNPTGLMLYTVGSIAHGLFGAPGAADGALRFEQNNGAAVGQETSGAPTALNQWQIVTLVGAEGKARLYRNGVKTLETPVGPFGGLPGSGFLRLLNNPQGDCALLVVALGAPSVAHLNTEHAKIGTWFNLAPGTVTDGLAADIAPAPIDLTATFLSTPNFPLAGALPTIAGSVPSQGVTLASGATQKFSLVFGSGQAGANITTGQQVRDTFFMNYFSGPQDQTFGSPVDTGQGGNNVFRGVARHYPVGDVNDVHRLDPDGLHFRCIASANYTDTTPGRMWVGMGRLPAPSGVFKPGMGLEIRYKAPSSNHSWTPIWMFTGEQRSPGPGGNAYTGYGTNASLIREGSNNHVHEIDWNDMFSVDEQGTPSGKQLIFGTPNIYGVSFDIPPQSTYRASGNGYSYTSGNLFQTRTDDWSAGFHTMYCDWGTDNILSVFEDGKIVSQYYMEYNQATTYTDENGVTQTLGMHLIVGNQGPALFTPGNLDITHFDGSNDKASLVVQWIKAWNGNVANRDSYRLNPGITYALPSLTPVFSSSAGVAFTSHGRDYRWYNQTGANGAVDGNGSLILSSFGPNPGTHILFSNMESGAGSWTCRFDVSGPGSDFDAGGLVFGGNGSRKITFIVDSSVDNSTGTLRVQIRSDTNASPANQINVTETPALDYARAGGPSWYLRAVRDNTYMRIYASPSASSGTFALVTQLVLSDIYNPDQIGVCLLVNGGGSGNQGAIALGNIVYSTSTDPQA